jgi:hypothetical protein
MNSTNFQDTLLGWRRHAGQNSFIDFMIMQEVSHNYEAYRTNSYMYKDKAGKLKAGPLWSFEAAWHNTANCNSSSDTGWCYNFGGVCGTDSLLPPFWWSKLTTDTSFMADLKCTYSNYRRAGGILDTSSIFFILDSAATKLGANGALTRNFTQWPIWGISIINEPTPMASNYTQEINNLKSFIKSRLAWLDTKWLSTSPSCYPVGYNSFSLDQNVSLYPNPAHDEVRINISGLANEPYTLQLVSIQGEKVFSKKVTNGINVLDISSLSKGVYFLSISSSKGSTTKKIVKE